MNNNRSVSKTEITNIRANMNNQNVGQREANSRGDVQRRANDPPSRTHVS